MKGEVMCRVMDGTFLLFPPSWPEFQFSLLLVDYWCSQLTFRESCSSHQQKMSLENFWNLFSSEELCLIATSRCKQSLKSNWNFQRKHLREREDCSPLTVLLTPDIPLQSRLGPGRRFVILREEVSRICLATFSSLFTWRLTGQNIRLWLARLEWKNFYFSPDCSIYLELLGIGCSKSDLIKITNVSWGYKERMLI